MPVSPKLLAAMRAKRAMKGAEPSPTADPVQDEEMAESPEYEATENESPDGAESVAMNHKEKAAHHLKEVQKRAKGSLAVHAKLALHHHNAYCKAMGH